MEFSQTKPNRAKRFIKEAVRVLRITKKPDRAEFLSLTKVTGLGCAIIGAIGFIIFMVKQLLL
jgi:protein transport protein SEC61 subunit gamma and related proteins